jgi:cytochrome c biogenesis factor
MKALSSIATLRWLVWREGTLAWRRRSDVLGTLFFFVMVVSLFPLSIGPETPLLRSIAPGVVWVAALLASMLSLNRLFAEDHTDGTLEQMLLTPHPIYVIVLGKAIAQWLVSAVPLILMAPLLGVQFLFQGVNDANGPNYMAARADIQVSTGGQTLRMLHPEKRIYNASQNAMSETAIDMGLFRDLYLSLGEPLGGGSWSVRIHYKPFVSWIWAGALLMAIGGGLAVSDRRYAHAYR